MKIKVASLTLLALNTYVTFRVAQFIPLCSKVRDAQCLTFEHQTVKLETWYVTKIIERKDRQLTN